MQRDNKHKEHITEKDLITLIKLLHPRKSEAEIYQESEEPVDLDLFGTTKEYAGKELGNVSTKTIQNLLYRMNDKNKDCAEPIEIAGQKIYLPIEEKRINNTKLEKLRPRLKVDRRVHYVTTQTMHPVFLQLNMAQLMDLFSALAMYSEYSKRNNMAVLADIIYAQLSPYATDRLEKLSNIPHYPIGNLLQEIKDGELRSDDERELVFHPEREMINVEDLTLTDSNIINEKAGI